MKLFKKIFLVDDDPVTNYIHREVIGMTVPVQEFKEFLNGEDALIYISENIKSLETLDLIFLDINMPRMNGFEFLRAIANFDNGASLRHIPIIMLSSSLNKLDKSKSSKFPNVIAYLTKPLSSEQLKLVIDQHQFGDQFVSI